MNKKLIKELTEKLSQEKKKLRKHLRAFAREDNKLEGDWDARYPKFDGGKLETEADEVQEYDKLLSIEHNFELRLRDVNRALEKIKKKNQKYGSCEKCGKKITNQRLKVYPEARLCKKCSGAIRKK